MATENIEGTATDENGNPLEDATIYVFLEQNTEPDGTSFTGIKTSTDSNGNFVLKDHPAADATSQEWHVAGYYYDGTGEFNALSKPSVEASVGPAIPDSVTSRPDDNTTTSGTFTGLYGIRISVSQDWPKIQGELSAKVDSALTRACVYHVSDGSLMGDVGISGNAGEVFTVDLDTALSAGEEYNFVVDAGGTGYKPAYYNNPSFAYISSDGNLEIVNGASGPTSTGPNTWNIRQVGNINL